MTDKATPISATVAAAKLAENRCDAILTFMSDGKPVEIAIPATQLPHLIISAAQAGGQYELFHKGKHTPRYIIEAVKWRVFQHPDGQHIVQEFHLAAGSVIQLQSPKALIPDMVKELKALHTAPPSSSTKN